MSTARILKVIAVVLFLLAFLIAAGWVDTSEQWLAPLALVALGLGLSTAADAT